VLSLYSTRHPLLQQGENVLKQRLRLTLAGLILGAIGLATVAWTAPDPTSDSSGAEDESCRFEIIGENSLSFDVWVMLYDSTVERRNRWNRQFFVGKHFKTQLKIQNQRLRRGDKLNRRYTAEGTCSVKRRWYIKVKRGTKVLTVVRETSGTGSDSRTVDIGRSSRW